MTELKIVRKKFWREKQKRIDNTYVSVAALEMPEVDRYAYGLPAEGKEYTYIKQPTKEQTKEKIQRKWEHSKQKATSIVKMLALTRKLEKSKTLPILKPLTSQGKKKDGLLQRIEDISVDDSMEMNGSEQMHELKALMETASEVSSIGEDSDSEVGSDV